MLYVEIGAVIVLIIINGLLAMSELAIVSSRPARLKAMVDRNVRGAAPRAQAQRRSRPLPVDRADRHHAGRRVLRRLLGRHARRALWARLLMPTGFRPGGRRLGVGIVVAIITYGSLIVGELVPKQIACAIPKRSRYAPRRS